MGLILIPKKYKVVYGDMNPKSEKHEELFNDENLAVARFEELRKQYLYVYLSEIKETVKRTTIRGGGYLFDGQHLIEKIPS